MVPRSVARNVLSGKITHPRPKCAAELRTVLLADVLAGIAEERGKSVAQVAINWLLCRPTVISVVIGACSEQQRLYAVSAAPAPYPYSHQRMFPELVKPLT